MIQRLRLLAGLVLFTYVTTHLLNHALGIISLTTAEGGRAWFVALWRNPLGTVVLYASLLTHMSLALYALYRRRSLRLPWPELLRLGLGLLIPLQLLSHAIATRLAHELFGVQDDYARQIATYWLLNPVRGFQQTALLLMAWTHGCIGIWYVLRATPGRARFLPAFRLFAVLLPLLALIGFLEMGRDANLIAGLDPGWPARVAPALPRDDTSLLDALTNAALALFFAAVAASFAGRLLRSLWQQRHGVVEVTYPDGRRSAVVRGSTLLEASRAAGIPHASLCGGRGRCSTCRIRIGRGVEHLPPPNQLEVRVLQRIAAPPNVRLACQTRPRTNVEIFPLLPPSVGAVLGSTPPAHMSGTERELAIMFVDMRAYTRFAERRLPYDVVFVLNQWNAALGSAIERAGGQPNQFIGDGILALFGLEVGPAQGCRQALDAAAEMAWALDELNRALISELPEPLRMGIGIHVGPVIVGEMGYGPARYLTAIGDAVNIASRLETLTKEFACQLVVSDDVALRAGLDLRGFPVQAVQVRGRGGPLYIRVVGNALDLDILLDPTARRAARWARQRASTLHMGVRGVPRPPA